MHSTTSAVLIGFLLLISVYLITRRPRPSSSLPLPPGPKPLPLIGNVHQAPKSHGWRTYRQGNEQYGPIVHLNMLGQPVIILSTSEVAHDLLAKRGAIFSDRPRLFLATELALKGLNILMMNYTDQFRHHQRLQVSGPHPDAFLPERWLDDHGAFRSSLPAPAFGYGRRTCPGRYFARSVLWIVVARLLWSLDIGPGVAAETGEPLPVDPEACTYGLVMRALPFTARFVPRGSWVREVIARAGDTYGTDHTALLRQIGAEFSKL
ncbi:cytochrome P450 [Aspergillus indologenus CBS 114.80]|uniref:Cytochrome P450 n=1 Tax=Aspergillus indologenus CBS 114.80 TaxID=1450541 RepID=A0A2V5IBJ6_9EURO|nr:cytochrome P450 [Aspergillus indologenus CBS 114.80]